MKGQYKGPMSLDEFYQSLYQDKSFFEKHSIKHLLQATIHFVPCNRHGKPVEIKDRLGRIVDGFVGTAAYKSAAELYDESEIEIEPEVVTQYKPGRSRKSGKTSFSNLPFSPV